MKITNVLTAIAAPLTAAAVLGVGVAIGSQTAAVGEPAPASATTDADCVAALDAAEQAIAAAGEYGATQEIRAAMAAGEGDGDPARVDAEADQAAERYRDARAAFEQAADACRAGQ